MNQYSSTLSLAVWHQRVGSTDELGQIRLSLNDLHNDKTHDMWLPLQFYNKARKQWFKPMGSPTVRLQLTPSGFRSPGQKLRLQGLEGEGGSPKLLFIAVKQAKKLRKVDGQKPHSAKVTLSLSGVQTSTKEFHIKTNHPKWDEDFVLAIEDEYSQSLLLTVDCKSEKHSRSALGWASIRFDTLKQGVEHPLWVPLICTRSCREAGQVLVHFTPKGFGATPTASELKTTNALKQAKEEQEKLEAMEYEERQKALLRARYQELEEQSCCSSVQDGSVTGHNRKRRRSSVVRVNDPSELHLQLKLTGFHTRSGSVSAAAAATDPLHSTSIEELSGNNSKHQHHVLAKKPKKTLMIQILGARNLKTSDNSKVVNPFVEIEFAGVKQRTEECTDRTTRPTWNECMAFVPTDLSAATIIFSVHYEKKHKHILLGEQRLELDGQLSGDVWHDLWFSMADGTCMTDGQMQKRELSLKETMKADKRHRSASIDGTSTVTTSSDPKQPDIIKVKPKAPRRGESPPPVWLRANEPVCPTRPSATTAPTITTTVPPGDSSAAPFFWTETHDPPNAGKKQEESSEALLARIKSLEQELQELHQMKAHQQEDSKKETAEIELQTEFATETQATTIDVQTDPQTPETQSGAQGNRSSAMEQEVAVLREQIRAEKNTLEKMMETLKIDKTAADQAAEVAETAKKVAEKAKEEAEKLAKEMQDANAAEIAKRVEMEEHIKREIEAREQAEAARQAAEVVAQQAKHEVEQIKEGQVGASIFDKNDVEIQAIMERVTKSDASTDIDPAILKARKENLQESGARPSSSMSTGVDVCVGNDDNIYNVSTDKDAAAVNHYSVQPNPNNSHTVNTNDNDNNSRNMNTTARTVGPTTIRSSSNSEVLRSLNVELVAAAEEIEHLRHVQDKLQSTEGSPQEWKKEAEQLSEVLKEEKQQHEAREHALRKQLHEQAANLQKMEHVLQEVLDTQRREEVRELELRVERVRKEMDHDAFDFDKFHQQQQHFAVQMQRHSQRSPTPIEEFPSEKRGLLRASTPTGFHPLLPVAFAARLHEDTASRTSLTPSPTTPNRVVDRPLLMGGNVGINTPSTDLDPFDVQIESIHSTNSTAQLVPGGPAGSNIVPSIPGATGAMIPSGVVVGPTNTPNVNMTGWTARDIVLDRWRKERNATGANQNGRRNNTPPSHIYPTAQPTTTTTTTTLTTTTTSNLPQPPLYTIQQHTPPQNHTNSTNNTQQPHNRTGIILASPETPSPAQNGTTSSPANGSPAQPGLEVSEDVVLSNRGGYRPNVSQKQKWMEEWRRGPTPGTNKGSEHLIQHQQKADKLGPYKKNTTTTTTTTVHPLHPHQPPPEPSAGVSRSTSTTTTTNNTVINNTYYNINSNSNPSGGSDTSNPNSNTNDKNTIISTPDFSSIHVANPSEFMPDGLDRPHVQHDGAHINPLKSQKRKQQVPTANKSSNGQHTNDNINSNTNSRKKGDRHTEFNDLMLSNTPERYSPTCDAGCKSPDDGYSRGVPPVSNLGYIDGYAVLDKNWHNVLSQQRSELESLGGQYTKYRHSYGNKMGLNGTDFCGKKSGIVGSDVQHVHVHTLNI